MPRFKIKRRQSPAVALVVIIILLLGQHYGWFGAAATTTGQTQPELYAVARDIDGDTIVVNTPSGEQSVRLIGVDTPETHDPRKPVQCYGPVAAAYTKKLVSHQKVKLVADPLDTNRDRYDRLLRYIYLSDGTLLNLRLIETGHGFYYPYFPFSKKAEFAAAEKQAQTNNLGLWSKCNPIPTDEGGFTSPPLKS